MSSLARVLVIGSQNNFLTGVIRSLKFEGLEVVTGTESSAGEFDYTVYSTLGEGHAAGLRRAREQARESSSRLIVLTDITQKGRSGFADKAPQIDERHVFLTSKNPVYSQVLWDELKRIIFSPAFKNKSLQIQVEGEVLLETPKSEEQKFWEAPRKTHQKKSGGSLVARCVLVLFILGFLGAFPFIELKFGEMILEKFETTKSSKVAKVLLNSSASGFELLSQIPMAQVYLVEQKTRAGQLAKYAGIREDWGTAQEILLVVGQNYFNREVQDISAIEVLRKDVQVIDNDLGFLRAEGVEVEELDRTVKGTIGFLEETETSINSGKEKSYLVVLTDPSVLKGAGGSITGFSLFKVRSGKVEYLETFSPDEIDSKLKGEIEPPVLLSKYYGVTSWHFKDSNWSPDFEASATRAIWFVEKILEKKVDGAITMDKDLVKLFKADGVLELAETLGEKLNRKQIAIFSKDAKLAGVLKDAGWDGGVKGATCINAPGCTDDYLQVVESSLNLAKNSFNAKKEYKLEVDLTGEKAAHKLTISYSSVLTGPIRDYLRVYLPSGTEATSAVLLNKTGVQAKLELDPGLEGSKAVYGAVVEVPKNETRELIVVWNTNKEATLVQYNLVWQKQIGQRDLPAIITIKYPNSRKPLVFGAGHRPELTKKGQIRYTTDLTQDEHLRLLWK
ncbi:MAG: DUF4012 domain-containing protein [bacterium]|nr:DUF4012 domain-containing protein [bacterium]